MLTSRPGWARSLCQLRGLVYAALDYWLGSQVKLKLGISTILESQVDAGNNPHEMYVPRHGGYFPSTSRIQDPQDLKGSTPHQMPLGLGRIGI